MKPLSLKLKEDVFKELEKVLREINISRNAYINEALAFYNNLYRRKILKRKLQKESAIVKDESMKVLGEFEKLEDTLPEW